MLIFSSSSRSICSSRVPRVTRLNTNTSRFWPMRSMRPMRCSIAIGFHGMSKLIRVLQNWMLRPSPPDSVHSSTGTRSRKSAIAASLSGPLSAPSKRAKAMPSRASSVGEVRERLAVVDEDQLLLVRVPPQQVEQRRLLAARCRSRPSSAPARASWIIDVAAGEAFASRRRPRPDEEPAAPSRCCSAEPVRRPAAASRRAARREFLVGRPLASEPDRR